MTKHEIILMQVYELLRSLPDGQVAVALERQCCPVARFARTYPEYDSSAMSRSKNFGAFREITTAGELTLLLRRSASNVYSMRKALVRSNIPTGKAEREKKKMASTNDRMSLFLRVYL